MESYFSMSNLRNGAAAPYFDIFCLDGLKPAKQACFSHVINAGSSHLLGWTKYLGALGCIKAKVLCVYGLG